jgi:hypothetical protein
MSNIIDLLAGMMPVEGWPTITRWSFIDVSAKYVIECIYRVKYMYEDINPAATDPKEIPFVQDRFVHQAVNASSPYVPNVRRPASYAQYHSRPSQYKPNQFHP